MKDRTGTVDADNLLQNKSGRTLILTMLIAIKFREFQVTASIQFIPRLLQACGQSPFTGCRRRDEVPLIRVKSTLGAISPDLSRGRNHLSHGVTHSSRGRRQDGV